MTMSPPAQFILNINTKILLISQTQNIFYFYIICSFHLSRYFYNQTSFRLLLCTGKSVNSNEFSSFEVRLRRRMISSSGACSAPTGTKCRRIPFSKIYTLLLHALDYGICSICKSLI